MELFPFPVAYQLVDLRETSDIPEEMSPNGTGDPQDGGTFRCRLRIPDI